MEIRQSQPSSEQQLELTESQQESPCQLFVFLAMTSIWLPPVQCLVAMTIFDFSDVTKTAILFLTLVYSCAVVLLSDLFGYYLMWLIAEGVHERRCRTTEICTSSKKNGLSDFRIATEAERWREDFSYAARKNRSFLVIFRHRKHWPIYILVSLRMFSWECSENVRFQFMLNCQPTIWLMSTDLNRSDLSPLRPYTSNHIMAMNRLDAVNIQFIYWSVKTL